MRPLSTFALEIQRGENYEPSHVSVVLSPPLSMLTAFSGSPPVHSGSRAYAYRQASDGFGSRCSCRSVVSH